MTLQRERNHVRTRKKQEKITLPLLVRRKEVEKKFVKRSVNKCNISNEISDILMVCWNKESYWKMFRAVANVRKLYDQQRYIYENKTHKVENRIVNLRQPYLRPIVGKTKSPVEFGAKLDVSVVDGFTRLEKQSIDVYNERAIGRRD